MILPPTSSKFECHQKMSSTSSLATDAEFWSSKPSSPDSVFSSEGISDYTSESNDPMAFKILDMNGIQLQGPSILMDLASRYSIQVRSRSPLEDACDDQFEDQRANLSHKMLSTGSLAQHKRRGQLPKSSTQANQSGRYKTELCRQWEELGFCEYADRCLFAHGEEEIKPLPNRHPKYKTEKCVAFHEQGFCSFGPRCSFIHTKPDPQSIIEEVLKKVSSMPDIPAGNMDDLTHIEDGDGFESLSGKGQAHRLPVFRRICGNNNF
ncbi:tis11 zinc finger protein [Brevipalpus obovatus]|uniref:tis11 zinc finger protein n=1 Tax=Brevipalpus obovatus TaxID=246614 RepID=UPI003D9EE982